MKRVELEILALTNSLAHNNSFTVILGEKDGPRRLPITIGQMEAQAIAIVMDDLKPFRPLTHDLFMQVLRKLNVKVKEVSIENLIDGIFYAHLTIDYEGQVSSLDSRTSDALALAIRDKAPIYIGQKLFDEIAVRFKEDEVDEIDTGEELEDKLSDIEEQLLGDSSGQDLSKLTTAELEELLQQALDQEDYEQAATIRDELSKR
ncbi:MAG: bifunctional nuclease domain-containing protein [Chitinophagales bacterium]